MQDTAATAPRMASVRAMPVVVILAAILLAAPAAADEYLPLSVGNSWEYVKDDGGGETQTVIGTITMSGTEVFDIRYFESDANEGLHSYMTGGPDGDVYLWGFFREEEDWGYAYSPAVTLADAPLFVGKSWTSVFDVYLLPGMTLVGQLSVDLEVTEEGMYTVPAGIFHAFGIATDTGGKSPHGDHGVSLLGRRPAPEGERTASNWWSDGLGQIQYVSGGFYKLSDYSFASPVACTSWGHIKALYSN